MKALYFVKRSERAKEEVCYTSVHVAYSSNRILAKKSERVKEEVCYTSVCVVCRSIADSVGLWVILLSLFSYPRNLRMLEDQILQDDCCISRRTFRFFFWGDLGYELNLWVVVLLILQVFESMCAVTKRMLS